VTVRNEFDGFLRIRAVAQILEDNRHKALELLVHVVAATAAQAGKHDDAGAVVAVQALDVDLRVVAHDGL
jgi:hypothetical protein